MSHVLDDAIGESLRGAHRPLSLTAPTGVAVRYQPDVGPFASVGLAPTAADWTDLAELIGDGSAAMFLVPGFPVPSAWTKHAVRPLSQLTDDEVDLDSFESLGRSRALTADDVPEMLRLTRETEPGPFERRTVELGGYRGVFDGDRLVAMAGRRINPPGFVEISAVCTDPAYRGRGLARELMLEVLVGIRADGLRGFLHVADGNPARALYDAMGFRLRGAFEVVVVSPA